MPRVGLRASCPHNPASGLGPPIAKGPISSSSAQPQRPSCGNTTEPAISASHRVMGSSTSDLRERYRSLALSMPMLLVLVCGANFAEAQQFATAGSQQSASNEPPASDSVQPKNDRIFGVLPNYRTVEDPKIRMAPLSAKGKFKIAIEDSFDPYAYVIAGAFAGLGQTKGDPKSWGEESWVPYIKRYGASFADQTSENIMTEAVVPWLLNPDPHVILRKGEKNLSGRAFFP